MAPGRAVSPAQPGHTAATADLDAKASAVPCQKRQLDAKGDAQMKLQLPLSLARPLAFRRRDHAPADGDFSRPALALQRRLDRRVGRYPRVRAAGPACGSRGARLSRRRNCRSAGKRGGRAVARPVFALLNLVCIYETAVTSRVLSNTVRPRRAGRGFGDLPSSAAFVGGDAPAPVWADRPSAGRRASGCA